MKYGIKTNDPKVTCGTLFIIMCVQSSSYFEYLWQCVIEISIITKKKGVIYVFDNAKVIFKH